MSLKEILSGSLAPKTFKRLLLGGVTTLTLSLFLFGQTTKLVQQSSLLSTGVNTCFQRLTQTFTSIVLQDKASPYIQNSFTSLTGECFAELTNRFQTSFLSNDIQLEKLLNVINTDAHWFNKRAQTIKSAIQVDDYEDEWGATGEPEVDELAKRKFDKIEVQKDKVLDVIEYNQMRMSNYANYLQVVMLIFSLLSLFTFVKYVGAMRKISDDLKDTELQAEIVLRQKDYYDGQKVDQLFNRGLRLAGLKSLADLFSTYHEYLLEKSATPISDEPVVEEDEIWSDEPRNEQEIVNLNSAFSAIVDLVSEKAFTHGVIVDFDIDDDLYIWAKDEVLQQILFTALSSSIAYSLNHNKGRKITVRSKPLGGTAYLKILINGHCFVTDDLEFISGNTNNASSIDVNLQLCNELIKDVNGKIVLRNIFDEMGSLTGSSTELLFDRAKPRDKESINHKEVLEDEAASKGKLVRLRRGRKKELIKTLNS